MRYSASFISGIVASMTRPPLSTYELNQSIAWKFSKSGTASTRLSGFVSSWINLLVSIALTFFFISSSRRWALSFTRTLNGSSGSKTIVVVSVLRSSHCASDSACLACICEGRSLAARSFADRNTNSVRDN
ncbi:hypothetical protein D3C73_1008370 [compost metagenome]